MLFLKRSTPYTVTALLLLLPIIGCASSMKDPEIIRMGEKGLIHTIAFPGETLSAISLWYTGAAENWTVLQEYNPGLDTKLLKVGDEVFIPMRTVVRKEVPSEEVLVPTRQNREQMVILNAAECEHLRKSGRQLPPICNSKDGAKTPSKGVVVRDDLFRELKIP